MSFVAGSGGFDAEGTMGLRGFVYVVAAALTAVAGFVAATGGAGAAPVASTFTTATGTSTVATITSSTTTTTTTVPQPPIVLPDRGRTPGVFNRAVRQRTIHRSICVARWTRKVRPPVRYTNALKLRQMDEYDETGAPSDYEEDHLIPLELGGAPTNPRNLWPEPRSQARASDPLETSLHRDVCHGRMTLARARAAIRSFKFTHG